MKVHSTPPKAFRRRSTLPLEATEDWGSGIAAEKQSFGADEATKGRGPGGTLDWEKSLSRHSSGPSRSDTSAAPSSVRTRSEDKVAAEEQNARAVSLNFF